VTIIIVLLALILFAILFPGGLRALFSGLVLAFFGGLIALLVVIVVMGVAHATMPTLTPTPSHPTEEACGTWAAAQDDDAIYMWGMQKDGTTSKEVAINRLAGSCMGTKPPAIVGFGSSDGFDQAYCKNHAAQKICKNR
jgi:hypothetical protein